MNRLNVLKSDIVQCQLCPRLRQHCENMAIVKRKAFRDQKYWGRPVPSFGDPKARLFILGLAPAAHGANRTGRVFTGDRSGDFLYRALHETGFASQPHSVSMDDGLVLKDAWVSASVRCAPPDNKPTPEEVRTCRPYVERELDLLPNIQVVVPLGQLAFNVYLSILKDRGQIRSRAEFRFGHDVEQALDPRVITSYHPSQQNTSTGKLTAEMLRGVFEHVRAVLR
jgi:uracil-DNA glycosylase family 4